MTYQSIFPPPSFPQTNILTYLHPDPDAVSDKPIWFDAVDPQRCLSPRQMLWWVRRLGFGFDRLAIPPGTVIMIVTPNHIFVPLAYQAIAGSGRIFSGANPTSTASELAYQIRNADAQLLLAHGSVLDNAVEAAQHAGLPKDRIFLFTDEDQQMAPTPQGILDWRAMAGTEEEGWSWTWDTMSDRGTSVIATINYSSGTTGPPKGVCISHASLIANAEQTRFMRDLDGVGAGPGVAAVINPPPCKR